MSIVLIFIFFIVICIILFYLYQNNNINNITTKYINKNPLKCCILLTMYIGNDTSRKMLYENRVNRWLTETNFEIFIVDSSGQYINQSNPRLHQYNFEQDSKFAPTNPSIYERDSLIKAFGYFNFSDYDIIFKVTGKYFIPDLENIIKYIPSDADFVLQNLSSIFTQYTEVIGFKIKLMKPILNLITKNNTFEEVMNKTIKTTCYKYYRLPPLKLDSFTKRGDGSTLTELFF